MHSMYPPPEVDLVNRDPNNVNDHIQVAFNDILAEPDGVHSINCVWSASFFCFNCCKTCAYNLYTFFFGICIAIEWGVQFGIVAFYHIWFITPFFKMLELNCGVIKKLYGLCIHCCLDPLFESCGIVFHVFRKN